MQVRKKLSAIVLAGTAISAIATSSPGWTQVFASLEQDGPDFELEASTEMAVIDFEISVPASAVHESNANMTMSLVLDHVLSDMISMDLAFEARLISATGESELMSEWEYSDFTNNSVVVDESTWSSGCDEGCTIIGFLSLVHYHDAPLALSSRLEANTFAGGRDGTPPDPNSATGEITATMGVTFVELELDTGIEDDTDTDTDWE